MGKTIQLQLSNHQHPHLTLWKNMDKTEGISIEVALLQVR